MDYLKLNKEIKKLNNFFEIKIIGKSYLKRNIFAINKIFNPNFKWAIITAGIHGREHLTSDLALSFASELAEIKKLDFNVSILPLLNPDGAELCINGGSSAVGQCERLKKINAGSDDFSLFKANARGVDLNNNFDANWDKKFSNVIVPSSQGFYGDKPFSESETKALKKWTETLKPFITINYHLKGQEIYFDFFQSEKDYERDKQIAEVFSASTGYKIKSAQDRSSGGYKDWCINHLHIPSLTIEVGDDRLAHPFPKSELKNIKKENKNIFEDLKKTFEIFNKKTQN